MCLGIVFFAACYEMNEEIVLREDGSGTYATRMDMSSMLQMMVMMAGEEEITKNGPRKVDTLIRMQDVIDTLREISADQRQLLKQGTLRFNMDIDQSVLKADMDFPFRNLGELQTLMSGSGVGGVGEIFRKMLSGKEGAGSELGGDQALDLLNTVFDVSVTGNSISRVINEARYKALMEMPELSQAKQMVGMGVEILYTTSIRLPRAVKKVNSPFAKLSDDKRTVTIKYDLMHLFDKPEGLAYSITY